MILEGVVDSLPLNKGNMSHFQMRVVSLQDLEGRLYPISRLQLSWYGVKKHLSIGDTWRLKVRLTRPRGTQNPAGYDQERWLFLQQIDAKGYVREWSGNQRIEAGSLISPVGKIREWVADAIDKHTDKPREAALLKALAVGDKRGFDQHDWQLFAHTGTNHLIAISGLHIGLVAGWSHFFGSWLWRRSSRLCLRWPAIKAGALIALLGATVYAALAGFTLPTQRALLMLAVTLGAVVLGYRVQFGRSLLLALFLVVLFDPFSPLSAGFWLSFLAVAIILWSIGGRIAPLQSWRQGMKIELSVTLGLLPVLSLFFNQISLISPLANLLMVPWFSLVLVPLLLLGLPVLLIPKLAEIWFYLLAYISGYTFQLLEWFAALPYALVDLPEQGLLLWLIALAGCLLLLMPTGTPGRLLGIWLILPTLFTSPKRPDEGEIWFTLLDVGQGLACVVETRDHLLLYDTGPKRGRGDGAAASVIIPFLKSRGYSHIDLLVVSNGDQDHAGGLDALTRALTVKEIVTGAPNLVNNSMACRAGQVWLWGDIRLQMLHPQKIEHFDLSNDRSCVLKIISAEWTILLPGDIEKAAEGALLQQAPQLLKSELIVAPHHGSNSSSTAAFVKAVDPKWVLISAGYKNRYGFPKPEVIARWQAQGATILNSAQTGAIEFRLLPGEENPNLRLYRELNRRYWQD
jgi:competence protein ComEC